MGCALAIREMDRADTITRRRKGQTRNRWMDRTRALKPRIQTIETSLKAKDDSAGTRGPWNIIFLHRRQRRLALLDFDGTLTDVEKEGEPFIHGYRQSLGRLLRESSISMPVDLLWIDAEHERHSRPEDFSWVYGKFLTAPASDPYTRSHAVLDLILDRLRLAPDPEERKAIKTGLFGGNYKKSATAFRDGARAFLEELIARMHVVIVTNSGTAQVQAKLDMLNPRGLDRITLIGDAKKYEIDPDWHEVPAGQYVDGLENRPVLLQRRMYHRVLTMVSERFGVPIRDMLFMGDIYDLDLALPQHIGARTALITREHTYSYELRAAKTVVNGLAEAAAFFGI